MKSFLLRPKVILWCLFLVLFVIAIVQNSEPTPFKFLVWSFAPIPKLFLILGSMVLGAIVTLILEWQMRRPKKTSTEAIP